VVKDLASSTIVSEVYITLAVVIAISIFSASVFGSLQQVADIEREKSTDLKIKLGTRVQIIFAAPYNSTAVKLWIKNIGVEPIHPTLIGDKAELFFGPRGNFKRIPYNTLPPTWIYNLVNDRDGDGVWDPTETIEVTVNNDKALADGDYYIRYVTYNGVYSEYTFTI